MNHRDNVMDKTMIRTRIMNKTMKPMIVRLIITFGFFR